MIFRNLRNVNNTKCATYDIIFICFEDEGEKMRGKEINKPVLEICCGSFSDVKTAYENGADRVELNSALYMGGAMSSSYVLASPITPTVLTPGRTAKNWLILSA